MIKRKRRIVFVLTGIAALVLAETQVLAGTTRVEPHMEHRAVVELVKNQPIKARSARKWGGAWYFLR